MDSQLVSAIAYGMYANSAPVVSSVVMQTKKIGRADAESGDERTQRADQQCFQPTCRLIQPDDKAAEGNADVISNGPKAHSEIGNMTKIVTSGIVMTLIASGE